MLGALVFILLFVFDWATLHEWGRIKQASFASAAIIGGFAQFKVVSAGTILPFIPSVPWIAWGLIIVFGALTGFSLFVDIPFRKTYASKDINRDGLVTTGTYALSRHPGVLWFILFEIGVVLLARRDLALYFALLLVVLDVLHVTMQDLVFFPRMFPQYKQYQQQTPFLIPTRASIRECFETLFPLRSPP